MKVIFIVSNKQGKLPSRKGGFTWSKLRFTEEYRWTLHSHFHLTAPWPDINGEKSGDFGKSAGRFLQFFALQNIYNVR